MRCSFYHMDTGATKHHCRILPSSSLAPGPSPPLVQQTVGASTGMPQAKELNGLGHSPTNQQTGCLKIPHLDTALPTRKPRTHLHQLVGRYQPQNPLGSDPALQGACCRLWSSFTHQGTDNKCKKTTILQPVDLACPPAGQALPWDQLDPGSAH